MAPLMPPSPPPLATMRPPGLRHRPAFQRAALGVLVGVMMGGGAQAATAWDYARSAGPVIGQAEACGMAADRLKAVTGVVEDLLDRQAATAVERRDVRALFDFMRQAAVQLHQRPAPAEGGSEPSCADALATFADLERRLPLWLAQSPPARPPPTEPPPTGRPPKAP